MLPRVLILVLLLCQSCVSGVPKIRGNMFKALKSSEDIAKIDSGIDKIKDGWHMVRDMAVGKTPDVLSSAAGFGNGYGRVVAIGSTMSSLMAGDTEGARWEITELLLVTMFIDVPQAFSLPVDLIKPLITTTAKTPAVTGTIAVMEKMHSSVQLEVRADIKQPMKSTMGKVRGVVQKFKPELLKEFDMASSGMQAYFANSKLIYVRRLMRFETLKAIFKYGFVLEFLNIGYSTYDLVKAAKVGDVDTVVIDAIGIAASVIAIFGTVATYAAAGSSIGPIGTAIGAALGILACVLGLLKPDPMAPINKAMEIQYKLAKQSITNLGNAEKYLKYMELEGFKFNWVSENNQGSMSHIDGLTPNKSIEFHLKGEKSELHEVDKDLCPLDKNMTDTCYYMGKRSLSKQIEGWFYKRNEKQEFTYPGEFYVIIKDNLNKKYQGDAVVYLRAQNATQMNKENFGAKIDLRDPSGKEVPYNDVVYIGHLPNIPKESKVIEVWFGKGKDAIEVSGLIGNWPETWTTQGSHVEEDRLHIYNKKDDEGNPDDTLSFYDMNSNKKSLEPTLDGLTIFEGCPEKPWVCMDDRTRGKRQKLCVVKLDSPPAVLVSSPFNDIISLCEHSLEIRNRKGRNKYILPINMKDLENYEYTKKKRYYNIMDDAKRVDNPEVTDKPELVIMINQYILQEKNDDGSFKANGKNISIEVVYRDIEQEFQIYAKNIDGEGKITLLRRVLFGSACDAPGVIDIHHPVLRGDDLEKFDHHPIYGKSGLFNLAEIDRLPPSVALEDAEPATHNSMWYFFYSRLEYPSLKNGIQNTCFCNPGNEKESYHILDMGDGADIVTISQGLYSQHRNTHVMNVVWMKTSASEDQLEWVFQFRGIAENDRKTLQRPHFDVVLRNVEFVRFETENLIFDLTDIENETPRIDLLNSNFQYENLYLGDGRLLNEIGTERDDIVYIIYSEGRLTSSPTAMEQHFDMAEGTDTIIIGGDYTEKETTNENGDTVVIITNEAIDYGIELNPDGSKVAWFRFIHKKGVPEVLRIENAERVACQYKGFTRTLPAWKAGISMSGFEKVVCEMPSEHRVPAGISYKDIVDQRCNCPSPNEDEDEAEAVDENENGNENGKRKLKKKTHNTH